MSIQEYSDAHAILTETLEGYKKQLITFTDKLVRQEIEKAYQDTYKELQKLIETVSNIK